MKKLLKGFVEGLLTVLLALLVGGLALGGCSDPPPPEDPPDPIPEPEPPPPPPKPTCEAMKDKCRAGADTIVKIPNVAYGFTPPSGWEYAMLEEATVTQQSDGGAVLVVTSMEHEKTSYKAKPLREAMVKNLAELVEIEPPSKLSFNRPNKRKIADLSMTLWENEAKRGDKKGALLLLSAVVEDREIFGIAYAQQGDTDGTKAILATLETFKQSGESDGGKDTKDGGDADGKKK
jgi:hypothetical protein